MMKLTRFWGVTLLLASLAAGAQAGQLRAGAARAEITPGTEVFPYTAKGERSFVGVHDPVYARALILDDGQNRAVIVAVEVTAIPDSAALVKALAAEAGTAESSVLVTATHTHNVLLVSYHGGEPDAAQAREIERVRTGALEAVRQAKANLQPAKIAAGRGEAWANVNNGEQAGVKSGYDPAGPSDKTLDVVRVETVKGEAIALLINYATHAEVMFRSATRDNGYEVSGDLPGAVSQMLEAAPAAAPVVLFTSGAEADQLPLFKSLQPAGRLKAADEGAAGWALLDVLARRVADAALGVVEKMHEGAADVRIEAAATTVSCPGKRPWGDPAKGSPEARPPVAIPISVIRINDIALAGVAGDVGSQIGRSFRTASPVAHSVFISMMAGSVGYIVADDAYENPGHGVMGSPLKPGCAEHAIVDGLVQLLKDKP